MWTDHREASVLHRRQLEEWGTYEMPLLFYLSTLVPIRREQFLTSASRLDARRHVNKMCMAANVPLVESGTAGYLGQVQPILKVRQSQTEGNTVLDEHRD